MIPVRASFVPIRQPEPPEGRMAIPVTAPLGAPLTFATGSEVYLFDSSAMAASGVHPSGILSAWIDATGITGASPAAVVIDTGTQKIVVPAGDQGYSILLCRMPAQITIAVESGATGTLAVVFMNYNVYATGSFATAASSGPTQTAATGSGGTGSGGSSIGSGGGSVTQPVGGDFGRPTL